MPLKIGGDDRARDLIEGDICKEIEEGYLRIGLLLFLTYSIETSK
jgi:hypothetical protein